MNTTRMREALQRIADWDLPATGETWPSGNPVSYETEHGSIGARAYIRAIARAALAEAEGQAVAEPVAWMWRNTKTGARGVYFDDPAQFFESLTDGDYEWAKLYLHPPTQPAPSN